MGINARGPRSNLRTDDMERWRVELRMTLDREQRRFHKANEVDYFEELLKAKLTDKSQEQQQQQPGLSLNLSRLDETAFTKLDNFLKTFMYQCPTVDQQNRLHRVLRDLLIDLKQEIYKQGEAGCLDPYCLYCGSSIQQRQAIDNVPDNCQLQAHHYVPEAANSVSTPPPSAAPTPDEGILNHSLQRLQSQFNNSFTAQKRGGRQATPPMSPSVVAALRLRQNNEAQRALEEARRDAGVTSQRNVSPIGLVNLNQQPNHDDEDGDLEQAEVASVRDIVSEVNRVMSSPRHGQPRSSTPMSSNNDSSELVMDLTADAHASRCGQPDSRLAATNTRVKKMREAIKNPAPGPRRSKKGGPRRKESQQLSFVHAPRH